MFILYESYNDSSRELKNSDINTKIYGVYDTKEKAINKFLEIVENTINYVGQNINWFCREVNTEMLNNKNIVKVCEVFNEEIGNYAESYKIILEITKE